MEKRQMEIAFILRVLHNQTKAAICRGIPKTDRGPQTQLQGGILGYLYDHREEAVYQRDIEKEFRTSRATATNTLQVMEKNGLIVRKNQDKDGRLKRILLTPEAEANQEMVLAYMKKMDERMLEGLTDSDRQQLYRYLKTIWANLERMNEECGLQEAGKAEGDP